RSCPSCCPPRTARPAGSDAPASARRTPPVAPPPSPRKPPTRRPSAMSVARSFRSWDGLRLAQAFDQRRAQQEGARELRILGGAAQLVVIARPHGGILLGQQLLVADGLRLRVLQRDVAALARVAVELILGEVAAQDADELVGKIERVVHAAVHAHG